jgi:hypothetical protein
MNAHALLVTPGVLFVRREVSWSDYLTGPFAAGIGIYDLRD